MALLDEHRRTAFLKLGSTAVLAMACGPTDVAGTQVPASVEQAAHGPRQGVLARIVEAAPVGPFASCEANVDGLSLQAGNYQANVTLKLSDFFLPDGLVIVRSGFVSAAAPIYTNSTFGNFFRVELSESPPASGEYRIRAFLRGPQFYAFSFTEEALACNVSILDPSSTEIMIGGAQASLTTPIQALPEANSARIAGEHLRCKWRLHDPPSPLEITASTTTDMGSDVTVFSIASGDPMVGPLDTPNGGSLVAQWMPPPRAFQSPTLEIRFDRFPMPSSRAGTCDFSATHPLGGPLGASKALVFSGAPPCMDGVDNDGDGFVDYPNEPGCVDLFDNDELDDCPNSPSCPECANGIDDDWFGDADYPSDPDCLTAADNSEGPRTACSDGIDNDGDALIDFPNDPGCPSPSDNNEFDVCPFDLDCPECLNGIDDDDDGVIDYPDDPGCNGPGFFEDELP